MNKPKFSDLIGRTLKEVRVQDDVVEFHCNNGQIYLLNHTQDCCERVYIADICGNLPDLIGSAITQAEENSSNDKLEGRPEYADSFTWTFYRIATPRGQVVFRWLGESNGYYSESVEFSLVQ